MIEDNTPASDMPLLEQSNPNKMVSTPDRNMLILDQNNYNAEEMIGVEKDGIPASKERAAAVENLNTVQNGDVDKRKEGKENENLEVRNGPGSEVSVVRDRAKEKITRRLAVKNVHKSSGSEKLRSNCKSIEKNKLKKKSYNALASALKQHQEVIQERVESSGRVFASVAKMIEDVDLFVQRLDLLTLFVKSIKDTCYHKSSL